MTEKIILEELLIKLDDGLLKKWYPLVLDKECGGYYSNLSYKWDILNEQDKLIVTQARHVWAASKVADFFNKEFYMDVANHGYKFLKKHMWDFEYGGFYQMRNRKGEISEYHGFFDEKRMYGNAFAIYGLSALYNLSKQQEILEFTKDAFDWIEKNAYDKQYGGYWQFLTREGKPFTKESEYKTKASDSSEIGFKDQNSSIHILEAYTEFYNVWKAPELKEKLNNILVLIRDTIATKKGYLNLFFDEKWKPISFRNASPEVREKNYGLDHVSFGHDYETAFLMLEASHSLELENDSATLAKAKKMIDHAIENGWDKKSAGFFDEGYYFNEDGECEIIKDTKVWWSQAEGLNALLLFSKIFPKEKKYYELFLQLWDYIRKYLMDDENGGWYWGSLEKEPHYKTEPKGSIWKGTYHTTRAMMNCIKMLSDKNFKLYKENEDFRKSKLHFDNFIEHWKKVKV